MSQTISRVYALEDVDIKRVDRKGRVVSAYATVFNIPTEIRDKHGHYWEEINRAGFNRTLSHGFGRVQVFYNHGYDLTGRPNMLGAVPVATPEDVRADSRGLVTVSRYNDGELADAILAAWEGGQIKGQSFSGKVYQDRDRGQRGGIPHVERMELGLREYGPTHSPAYEDAGLIAIRSQDELLELVRSMIHDITTGTPGTAPPEGGKNGTTATAPGAQDADSGQTHSSVSERLILKRRRILGER
jgi:HK97 family phage prohead protease